MVRRNHRGTGVGRHLIDLILASRSERFAILSSNPAALARQIYEQYDRAHPGEAFGKEALATTCLNLAGLH